MTNIYDQHRSTFARVSAFVVVRNGERVATIAFKYPKDGAGRLYAYVHWIGIEMVRGSASGYGYDKRSAAVADVARKMLKASSYEQNTREHANQHLSGLIHALSLDDGMGWDRNLEKAGFTLWEAV